MIDIIEDDSYDVLIFGLAIMLIVVLMIYGVSQQ